MHYYQFNIGDYLSHTRHLTPTEDLCYRRLLDYYYLHEKPIPLNPSESTRLICLGKEWVDDVFTILNEFFVKTDAGWINPRADKEIKQYQGFAEAGKRGAEKRWSKPSDNPPISPPKQGLMLNTNHKTINNNYKPLTITPLSKSNDFDEFWRAYPKKVGKDSAIKAWDKAKPRIDDVMAALSWQIKSEQWFKSNGQFIPNPTTYINQGRWQDEPVDMIGF